MTLQLVEALEFHCRIISGDVCWKSKEEEDEDDRMFKYLLQGRRPSSNTSRTPRATGI